MQKNQAVVRILISTTHMCACTYIHLSVCVRVTTHEHGFRTLAGLVLLSCLDLSLKPTKPAY